MYDYNSYDEYSKICCLFFCIILGETPLNSLLVAISSIYWDITIGPQVGNVENTTVLDSENKKMKFAVKSRLI